MQRQKINLADEIYSIFIDLQCTSMRISTLQDKYQQKYHPKSQSLFNQTLKDLPFIQFDRSSVRRRQSKNNFIIYLIIELDDCCSSKCNQNCRLLHSVRNKHLCMDNKCTLDSRCSSIHRPHTKLIQRLKECMNALINEQKHKKQTNALGAGVIALRDLQLKHNKLYPKYSSHQPTPHGISLRFRNMLTVTYYPDINDFIVSYKARDRRFNVRNDKKGKKGNNNQMIRNYHQNLSSSGNRKSNPWIKKTVDVNVNDQSLNDNMVDEYVDNSINVCTSVCTNVNGNDFIPVEQKSLICVQLKINKQWKDLQLILDISQFISHKTGIEVYDAYIQNRKRVGFFSCHNHSIAKQFVNACNTKQILCYGRTICADILTNSNTINNKNKKNKNLFRIRLQNINCVINKKDFQQWLFDTFCTLKFMQKFQRNRNKNKTQKWKKFETEIYEIAFFYTNKFKKRNIPKCVFLLFQTISDAQSVISYFDININPNIEYFRETLLEFSSYMNPSFVPPKKPQNIWKEFTEKRMTRDIADISVKDDHSTIEDELILSGKPTKPPFKCSRIPPLTSFDSSANDSMTKITTNIAIDHELNVEHHTQTTQTIQKPTVNSQTTQTNVKIAADSIRDLSMNLNLITNQSSDMLPSVQQYLPLNIGPAPPPVNSNVHILQQLQNYPMLPPQVQFYKSSSAPTPASTPASIGNVMMMNSMNINFENHSFQQFFNPNLMSMSTVNTAVIPQLQYLQNLQNMISQSSTGSTGVNHQTSNMNPVFQQRMQEQLHNLLNITPSSITTAVANVNAPKSSGSSAVNDVNSNQVPQVQVQPTNVGGSGFVMSQLCPYCNLESGTRMHLNRCWFNPRNQQQLIYQQNINTMNHGI